MKMTVCQGKPLGMLLLSLVLAALTNTAIASHNGKPSEDQLAHLYSITWEGFAKLHPPHKHCQKNNENGEGFVRCFLDQQKVEGLSGWKADYLFFNGVLIELQLTRPTDTPATYDDLKNKLSKTLWLPVSSEINNPSVNVRDQKMLHGDETRSWTYRETNWKQELANKKHREILLSESIEFPKAGEKSTKPTGVSIRVKHYNPNHLP